METPSTNHATILGRCLPRAHVRREPPCDRNIDSDEQRDAGTAACLGHFVRRKAVSSLLTMFGAVGCIASLPIHAQQARVEQWLGKLPQRFALADTDKDGRLTREEARHGMPGIFKRFDQIDTAGRGWVTREDIRRAVAEQGQHR
jgi:hypothetical protein